jgi:segregation and condensation protein B
MPDELPLSDDGDEDAEEEQASLPLDEEGGGDEDRAEPPDSEAG